MYVSTWVLCRVIRTCMCTCVTEALDPHTDKSLLWLVHFPHTNQRRDLSIMYPGNTEPITVCREVYQINQVLSKSVSTSSVLSWYMGNVHRSVPLMLPSTRIHKYIRTCVMYCVGCTLYTCRRCILQVAIFL